MPRKRCAEERDRSPLSPSMPRSTANERERDRMRAIGNAFNNLKCHLPWIPGDTKLSKADTLRLASAYIQHLNTLLTNDQHCHTTTNNIESNQWPWRKLEKSKRSNNRQLQ